MAITMRRLLLAALAAASCAPGDSAPLLPPQIKLPEGGGVRSIDMTGEWVSRGAQWRGSPSPTPQLPPLWFRVRNGGVAEAFFDGIGWDLADRDTFGRRIWFGAVDIRSYLNIADGRRIAFGFSGVRKSDGAQVSSFILVGTTDVGSTLPGMCYTKIGPTEFVGSIIFLRN